MTKIPTLSRGKASSSRAKKIPPLLFSGMVLLSGGRAGAAEIVFADPSRSTVTVVLDEAIPASAESALVNAPNGYILADSTQHAQGKTRETGKTIVGLPKGTSFLAGYPSDENSLVGGFGPARRVPACVVSATVLYNEDVWVITRETETGDVTCIGHLFGQDGQAGVPLADIRAAEARMAKVIAYPFNQPPTIPVKVVLQGLLKARLVDTDATVPPKTEDNLK